MSCGGGVMDGLDNGLSLMRWDVHAAFEVQVAIGNMPIIHGGVRKQGGSSLQTF